MAACRILGGGELVWGMVACQCRASAGTLEGGPMGVSQPHLELHEAPPSLLYLTLGSASTSQWDLG